jgi:hypothetical protein
MGDYVRIFYLSEFGLETTENGQNHWARDGKFEFAKILQHLLPRASHYLAIEAVDLLQISNMYSNCMYVHILLIHVLAILYCL